MLTNMKEQIKKAHKEKYAIPQFNINNLEWTRYILEASQELNNPVILGVSEGAIEYMGGYNTIVSIVEGLIKDLNITIPVSIHLDHGSTIESCKKAIKAGFTSIMLDNSKLPLKNNIEETKKLIELSKNKVLIEAEIGPIGTTKENENYTRKEDCIEMSKLNIDALAIAIGNIHGEYKGEVNLDLKLLEQIKQETNIPLVLHGASCIPENLLKECIKKGINKVNFNTELQLAWNKEIRKYIEKNKNVYDPRKIIKSGEQALKEKVKEKIQILNRP
ncbi:MAG: ketose-bisphosphate aldolase [Bacilli bacterium]|nr:ketose-bisphosphate aldolase [Bacilli bacterium]